MLPQSEHRAAELAVSRFGAEAARVQQLYHQVVASRALGKTADLLELLVQQKVLTTGQAQELRAGLDATHIDTSERKTPSANGSAPPVSRPTSDLNVLDLRQIGSYRILRRLGEGGMSSVFWLPGRRSAARGHQGAARSPQQQPRGHRPLLP
jgi:hypothetical protein